MNDSQSQDVVVTSGGTIEDEISELFDTFYLDNEEHFNKRYQAGVAMNGRYYPNQDYYSSILNKVWKVK